MSDPTIEELERRRRERAREVQVVTSTTPKAASDCLPDLSHLKPHPDAEKRRAQARARERELITAELRTRWNAPERHRRTSNLNRGGKWGEVDARIASFAGSGFLLGLIGTRGSGKTQLAIQAMKRCTAAGRSARYESAMSFFMAIKSTYRQGSELSEQDVLDRFRAPKLLVLDEIGKRGETDWEDRLLTELIDSRYRDMRDTLLISNQDRNTFLAAVGQSIASRMCETGGIIECNWPSFRNQ